MKKYNVRNEDTGQTCLLRPTTLEVASTVSINMNKLYVNCWHKDGPFRVIEVEE